jgi:hypothetical protein
MLLESLPVVESGKRHPCSLSEDKAHRVRTYSSQASFPRGQQSRQARAGQAFAFTVKKLLSWQQAIDGKSHRTPEDCGCGEEEDD